MPKYAYLFQQNQTLKIHLAEGFKATFSHNSHLYYYY